MQESEVEKAILTILETNNRPFNCNNLRDDLCSRFKKSIVDKALKVILATRPLSKCMCSMTTTIPNDRLLKILSKFKKFQVPNADELNKLDSDILEFEAKQETLQKDLQMLLGENDKLTTQLSTDELEIQVKNFKGSTKSLQEQLEKCKRAGKSKIAASAYDKKTLETSLCTTISLGKKRKRLCMNALKELEAGSGMKMEELYDVVGIEEEEG
eukprot:763601-Hanusia_phi.AAC.2